MSPNRYTLGDGSALGHLLAVSAAPLAHPESSRYVSLSRNVCEALGAIEGDGGTDADEVSTTVGTLSALVTDLLESFERERDEWRREEERRELADRAGRQQRREIAKVLRALLRHREGRATPEDMPERLAFVVAGVVAGGELGSL